MTNLTAEQIARIATMDAADAACWTAYYTEQNESDAGLQDPTDKAILKAVRAGVVEPTEVRRAVRSDVRGFNEAVRFLKATGALQVEESGLFFA